MTSAAARSLVNGAGPIGSLVVAAAKYRGAATVIAADLAESSLAVARRWAPTRSATCPPATTLPDGRRTGVRGVRAAGRARRRAARRPPAAAPWSQVGNLPGTAVPAVLGDLVTREITWIGSYRFVDEITDALLAMPTASTCPR